LDISQLNTGFKLDYSLRMLRLSVLNVIENILIIQNKSVIKVITQKIGCLSVLIFPFLYSLLVSKNLCNS